MNTLSATDTRRMLRAVQDVEVLTNAMRHTIRPPTPKELYGAAAGIQIIRDTLLNACLADVGVEVLVEVG